MVSQQRRKRRPLLGHQRGAQGIDRFGRNVARGEQQPRLLQALTQRGHIERPRPPLVGLAETSRALARGEVTWHIGVAVLGVEAPAREDVRPAHEAQRRRALHEEHLRPRE